MTTRETFRQAVVTQIQALAATWVEYPLIVEYDNRTVVDTQKQTNPFLCVQIVYMGGEQVTLGTTPHHRVSGQIHLAAAVRDGQGSARSNALLQHFYPTLHLRSIDGARMWGASFEKDRPHLGWVYSPILIPFDYDTTT